MDGGVLGCERLVTLVKGVRVCRVAMDGMLLIASMMWCHCPHP
jgi:hypothetical protein